MGNGDGHGSLICWRPPAVKLDTGGVAPRGRWRGGVAAVWDWQRAQTRRPVAKGRDDGLTPEQRRERDAKALQEKAARKAAQAAGGGDAKGAGKNAGK